MKTILYVLAMIAILGSGISCSKKSPDSNHSGTGQPIQSNVISDQEKDIAHGIVAKTDKQNKVFYTGKEAKLELNHLENSRSAQIVLWQSGVKKGLDGADQWITELQHDCETLFISADDILREAVTKWTLERIRADKAVELIYKQEQHFKVRVGTKSMHVDGLLIPLKPLHGNTVVVYYRLSSYSAGPLINSQGKKITDRLTETLKKHGLIDK